MSTEHETHTTSAQSAVRDGLDCCSHCGRKYNPDAEGNYDEATDLYFCGPECEMNYDREIGLLNEYQRAI
ncbi:MAG: hypothetical protein WC373_13470 [Smithella sp.]|jgi:hypothetical protein